MNNFDKKFFKKYIPEWQEMLHIVHTHWINIAGTIILWLFLAVFLPSFFYFESYRLKDLIPFFAFEMYLIIVYIKIIYDIFDWYNDVWIITNGSVIDLDWSIFKTTMSSIDFWNIEGMEVDENSFIDKILKKWDLIIHKIWDDSFVLPDCISPYKALNEVENIRNQIEVPEDDGELDRFDMIMDTLGWVVENYLHHNHPIDDTKIKEEENIEKYSQSKNSIDLR